VALHGTDRDEQPGGDLRVGQVLPQRGQHLSLPGRHAHPERYRVSIHPPILPDSPHPMGSASYASAMTATKILIPPGRIGSRAPCRAGGSAGNHLPHSSFIPAKSSSSASRKVALSTLPRSLPAASRMARTLARHCRVCSWMVVPSTWPLTGSNGPLPGHEHQTAPDHGLAVCRPGRSGPGRDNLLRHGQLLLPVAVAGRSRRHSLHRLAFPAHPCRPPRGPDPCSLLSGGDLAGMSDSVLDPRGPRRLAGVMCPGLVAEAHDAGG
jgi:hypothetical protein